MPFIKRGILLDLEQRCVRSDRVKDCNLIQNGHYKHGDPTEVTIHLKLCKLEKCGDPTVFGVQMKQLLKI